MLDAKTLNMKIDELKLTVRFYNILKRGGINTVYDLIVAGPKGWFRLPRMESAGMAEITGALAGIGVNPSDVENPQYPNGYIVERDALVKPLAPEYDFCERLADSWIRSPEIIDRCVLLSDRFGIPVLEFLKRLPAGISAVEGAEKRGPDELFDLVYKALGDWAEDLAANQNVCGIASK